MAFLKFKGIGISAMAGAVPKHIIKNLEYTEFFPEEQVKEVVENVDLQMLLLVLLIYVSQPLRN